MEATWFGYILSPDVGHLGWGFANFSFRVYTYYLTYSCIVKSCLKKYGKFGFQKQDIRFRS